MAQPTKFVISAQEEFKPGFSAIISADPNFTLSLGEDDTILTFPVDGTSAGQELFGVYNDGISNPITGAVQISHRGVYSIALSVTGYALSSFIPPIIIAIARAPAGQEVATVIYAFPPAVNQETGQPGRVEFQTSPTFTAELNAGDTLLAVVNKLAVGDPVFITGLSRFSVQMIDDRQDLIPLTKQVLASSSNVKIRGLLRPIVN